MPQIGLYDMRNRVYSPTLQRFMQPDPIGFAGDPANLYRYCGNNGTNVVDDNGLSGVLTIYAAPGHWYTPWNTGHVFISYTPDATGVTT